MKHLNTFLLLVLLLGCSNSETNPYIENQEPTPIGEFLDDWTYKVNPTSASNFDVAEFRLWVPENNSNLKAILVLTNSYNSNGLGLALSVEWQAYATINNLAIIAVHLKSLGATGYYGDASSGSGHALLTALDKITEQNNISSFSGLPFLLRGYSAGGVFSYSFSDFKPERVIAFANIRGGSMSITSDHNLMIPGLLLIGEFDDAARNEAIKNIFESKRNINGLWSYAIEPNETHYGSLENSDELIKLFFIYALNNRISEQSNELLTISEASGWLGNNISKEVFLFDTYSEAINQASWLINEDFAHAWKDYQIE